MDQKMFNRIAGVIFLFAFALHLVRAVNGWELVYNGYLVPLWLSWIVSAIAAAMVWSAWKMGKG